MCARDDIDKRNIKNIYDIIKRYPNILEGYIGSLTRKTSYTKLAYTRYVTRFIDYISDKLKYDIYDMESYIKIKPMDIDSYINHIGYNEDGTIKSSSYINVNYAAIKGFFNYLKKNNIIVVNPCDHIETPKDNKIHEIVTISTTDYNIILNNINNGVGTHKAKARQRRWIERDTAILILGLTTGIRVGAIAGIDIDDVDLVNRNIKITEKGNRERVIYIGDKTVSALKRWMDVRFSIETETNALFITDGGGRISTRTIQRRFNTITEGTSKHITPHKMRATCATTLYEKTGDLYLVQDQLGHKNIKNTEMYAKISNARKQHAANILDAAY